MIDLPEGTVATVADLDAMKLQTVLDEADQGYYFYHAALNAAAAAAVAMEEYRWAKVIDLVASACSMSLVPGSASQPFRPCMEIGNRRSVMPEDFSQSDIALISELAPLVGNKMVGARLHDIAWHCLRPRVPQHASDAIDCYRSIKLTENSWIADGRECWLRAITLVRMRRGDERLADIVAAIEAALFTGSHENGYLSLWLADTLREHRLAKESAPRIATHLRGIADAIKNSGGDPWRARDYYGAAGEWYKVGQDDLNESAMTIAVAESFYSEAKSRIEGEHPSHMAAASFLEDAILMFRRVPGSRRVEHGIDERIEQLQRELREAGEKSHEEMGTISSGPIDVLDLVTHAEQSVGGKSLVDALAGLATLFNISNYQKSKEQAKTALCAHPLMASMHGSVLGRDGNVVAKRPGFNMAEPDSESNEAAIRAQMVQTQAQVMGLRVQALILPALEIVRLEHGVKLQQLIQFASQTSIVPPGRERLVAQGLHYGFEGNWASAIHLLVPQLEHLVRHHIKQNGAITTVMSAEGVVNEVGLSGLMTLPEVEGFFGPNYAFEIRALFCDHYGPNLRNELAHGLLSDREAFSAESVYAWWFMFMLIMTGWLHELKGRIAQAKSGDAQADPDAASDEGVAAPTEAGDH